jgi:hypothetical protein
VGNRDSRVGRGALGRSRSLHEVKVSSTSDKRPVPESPPQRCCAVPAGRSLGRVRLEAAGLDRVIDGRFWPDSAGSQLSAIAEPESAALTGDLAIASKDDVRLHLQQETNGREPAAPCTCFPARIRNRPESRHSRRIEFSRSPPPLTLTGRWELLPVIREAVEAVAR